MAHSRHESVGSDSSLLQRSDASASGTSPGVEVSPDRAFELDKVATYRRLALAIRSVCPRWLMGQREDLAQRAALKILEQASKGNIRQPICSSYLNCIAASVVIDEIRYRRRRPEESTDLSGSDSTTPQVTMHEVSAGQRPCARTPETQVQDQALANAICACLQKLGPDRRLAATLGLQGYSAKEIADTFEWTAKRAKNLYFRSRVALQKCLTHKGFDLDVN